MDFGRDIKILYEKPIISKFLNEEKARFKSRLVLFN